MRKCKVEKKKNDLLNRINKTKREAEPDLAAERERYDKEISHVKRQELQVCNKAAAAPEAASLAPQSHVLPPLLWLQPLMHVQYNGGVLRCLGCTRRIRAARPLDAQPRRCVC